MPRLMLSERMLTLLGPQLRERHPALELVSIESAVAAQRRDIDAVFISREVTGASTKHEVHPELQACYDLMLANSGLRWVHIHSGAPIGRSTSRCCSVACRSAPRLARMRGWWPPWRWPV